MHTHILPNVDDGAKSIDISRALLMKEIEEGVEQAEYKEQKTEKILRNGILFIRRGDKEYNALGY